MNMKTLVLSVCSIALAITASAQPPPPPPPPAAPSPALSAALLAPPTRAVRQGSDMRRGIVLVMVGFGLMVCFGAWNDWEGGAWAIGVIPFVIGLGYLLVWKLEGGKKNEIPPAPPTS